MQYFIQQLNKHKQEIVKQVLINVDLGIEIIRWKHQYLIQTAVSTFN